MVFYRRNFIPGGSYFFTVALTDRKRDWLVRHINLLRLAFRRAKRERPFTIDAIVVLPEHLHCVWTLPPGDADYSHRWRLIKARFSRVLSAAGAPIHQSAKGEYNVWQRRFWEHTLRDERDLQAHVDYIHYNPVKHDLVTRVGDWPYSSFHRFVRMGWLSADWADDPNLSEGMTGE
jgi:REP-associated tyrosine transposase